MRPYPLVDDLLGPILRGGHGPCQTALRPRGDGARGAPVQ